MGKSPPTRRRSRRKLDAQTMRAMVLGPPAWLELHGGEWVSRPDPDLVRGRPKLRWLTCETYEKAVREYQAAHPELNRDWFVEEREDQPGTNLQSDPL